MAVDAPDYPVDDVLSYGQQNDYSPEDTASAVKQWRSQLLDYGADASGPQDYFNGAQQIDQQTQAALNTLRPQSNDPDDEEGNFSIPRQTNQVVPITQGPHVLADFLPRVRDDGGLDLLLRAYDPDGNNAPSYAHLKIPAVTDSDITSAQQQAGSDEQKFSEQADDEEAQNRTDSVGNLTSALGLPGNSQTSPFRQQAADAASRAALLADPNRARAVLMGERAADALRKSPLADQVGRGGIIPVLQNFAVSVDSAWMKTAALVDDAVGNKKLRDQDLGGAQMLQDELGDSQGQFKGGAAAIPGEVSSTLGSFAPAIASGPLAPITMAAQGAGDADARAIQQAQQMQSQAADLRAAGDNDKATWLESQATEILRTRGLYAGASGVIMGAGGAVVPKLAAGAGVVKAAARGGAEMTGLMGVQGQGLDPAFLGENQRMSAGETLKQGALGAVLGGMHAALEKADAAAAARRNAASVPVVDPANPAPVASAGDDASGSGMAAPASGPAGSNAAPLEPNPGSASAPAAEDPATGAGPAATAEYGGGAASDSPTSSGDASQAIPAGPGAAGSSEYGVRQFSMRAAASPELRDSWRAGITPELASYFKFNKTALSDWVSTKVNHLGLEDSYSLFQSDPGDSGLASYERVALGGELMRRLDSEAGQAEQRGDAPQAAELNGALDNVFGTMEQLSTSHAQGLNAFGEVLKSDPNMLLRKVVRDTAKVQDDNLQKDFPAEVPQQAADVATDELQRSRTAAVQNLEGGQWDPLVKAMADMAQEAKRRGQQFQFKLTGRSIDGDRRNLIRSAENKLANMRETLEGDGASKIAGSFFREEQPNPRTKPGPLVEGSDLVRNDLAAILNESLDKLGVKRPDVTKPKPDEVARLVRQLGLDDLKQGKMDKVDKMVRDRISGVLADEGGSEGFTAEELGARQDWADEMLKRWEQVSSSMRDTSVSGATLRRVVNGVAREHGIDTSNPAEGPRLAKIVRDRVAGQSDSYTTQGLDNVEKMVGDTFSQMLREKQAAQARAQAAKGKAPVGYERMADWMNNQYAKAFSDTPSLSSKPNLLRALVNQHLKQPTADFQDRARALGVRGETAATLERMLSEQRKRADAVARAKAGDTLVKRLQDAAKTPDTKSRVPAVVKTLLEGYETGAVSREDFLNAYAKAFKLPVLDAATRARLSDLKTQINDAPPKSLPRQELMRQFMQELDRMKGFKLLNFASDFWYANKLSGISTTVGAGDGNAAHLFVRSLAVAASDPRSFPHYLKGMLEGFRQAVPEMKAALQGKATRSDVERGQWDLGKQLELLYNDDGWKTLGGSAKNLLSTGRFVGRGIKALHFLAFYGGAREAMVHKAAADWAQMQVKTHGGDFKGYLADALHNTPADMMAAMKQAKDESALLKKPLSDGDMQRRAWEIVDQNRSADITGPGSQFGQRLTHQQARETGTVGTLMDAADAFFNRANMNVGAHGNVNLPKLMISPFMHFIGNSLSNSLDFTPVGIVRGLSEKFTKNAVMDWSTKAMDMVTGKRSDPRGPDFAPAEAKERLAAGIGGTLLAVSLGALAYHHKDDDDVNAPFMVYGEGPPDPGKRSQMPPGWRPFSIKLGHSYWNYGESVLAPALGTIGQIMDAERYKHGFGDQSLAAKAAYSATAAAHLLTNHSAAQGLHDAIDAINGNHKVVWPMVGRAASGFIAPTGLLADINRLFAAPNVKAETLWGAMMKDIPFIRTSANAPSRNVFGDPVSPQGLERLPIGRIVRDEGDMDPDFQFLGEHKLSVPNLRGTMVVLPSYLHENKAGAEDFYQQRANKLGAAYEKIWTEPEAERYVKMVGDDTRSAVQLMRASYAQSDTKPTQEQLQKELNARVHFIRQLAARKMVLP